MDAKELRLGNLIYSNLQIWEVVSIDELEIRGFPYGSKNPYDEEELISFSGMPLTEAWLERMINKSTSGVFNFRPHGAYTVEVKIVEDTFGFYVHGHRITVFKYIHELQNLYHILCGEDLIIK